MARFDRVVAGLVLALAVGPAVPACADPGDRDHHHHGRHHDHGHFDHDEARLAVERGEIRPLAELLTVVRDKLPGEITSVEIEREDGRWLYEFLVVGKQGRLYQVHVDAVSGDIQRTREK